MHGIHLSLTCTSVDDMDRALLHSREATITIPSVDLVMSSSQTAGVRTTVGGLLKAIAGDIRVNGQCVFNSSSQQSVEEFLQRLEALPKCSTSWEFCIRDPNAEDCFLEGALSRPYRRPKHENYRLGILHLPHALLPERSIGAVVEHVRKLSRANISILCGAGISTSCGIPDFRTPGSGVYSNLQEYNLPTPESIFTLSYFLTNPSPYWHFRSKYWDGTYTPSPTHFALASLCSSNVVKKIYTQNIDGLELAAGVPISKLEQVHGSMETAFCHDCRKSHVLDKEIFSRDTVPRCACGGLVRPSTVMFGESIAIDMDRVASELEDCDILFVLGTSLAVPPINEAVHLVPHDCVRVFVNLTEPPAAAGFDLAETKDVRDVFLRGACDQVFPAIVKQLMNQ